MTQAREYYNTLGSLFLEAAESGRWEDSVDIMKETKRLYRVRVVEEKKVQDLVAEVSGLARKKGGRKVAEDITFDNNSVLYDSVVAAIVQRALRAPLLSQRIIRMVKTDFKGAGSIDFPASQLLTAAETPDNAALSYPSSKDYSGGATANARQGNAAQKITLPLLRQSMVDLLREQAEEIAHALGVLQDTKVLTEFLRVTDDAFGQANFKNLGGSVDISWGDVEEQTGVMQAANAFPTTILTNPVSGRILRNGMNVTQTQTLIIGGEIHEFPVTGGQRLIAHPSIPANTTYLVDYRQGGLLFFDDVRTESGRIHGSLAFDIAGYQTLAVQVGQPKALFRIMDNTA